MDFAYMDNASGTRLLDEVFDEMIPYFKTEFGNPSSIHTAGSKPKAALEHAREQVASLIGAQPKEIYPIVEMTKKQTLNSFLMSLLPNSTLGLLMPSNKLFN